MKVTTLRFSSDLWRLLEGEADRAGVSVSQFVREAALARAAGAAAARGEEPLALLAGLTASRGRGETFPGAPEESHMTSADRARFKAAEERVESTALAAQSEQALRRAQSVAARSGETIRQAHERRARRRERP